MTDAKDKGYLVISKEQRVQERDDTGIPGVTAYFYKKDTTIPVQGYSDVDCSKALSVPAVTDMDGSFKDVYVNVKSLPCNVVVKIKNEEDDFTFSVYPPKSQ